MWPRRHMYLIGSQKSKAMGNNLEVDNLNEHIPILLAQIACPHFSSVCDCDDLHALVLPFSKVCYRVSVPFLEGASKSKLGNLHAPVHRAAFFRVSQKRLACK